MSKISKGKLRRLRKAAKDGHSIIHFSNLKNKLGINPKTTFNTPAGVYGYILTKDSLKCILGDDHLSVGEIIESCGISEFGHERDYVYVAELKKTNREIIKVNEDFSSNFNFCMFNEKIDHLFELIRIKSPLVKTKYHNINKNEYNNLIDSFEKNTSYDNEFFLNKNKESKENKKNIIFGYFWNITRNFARNPIAWGSLLYKLGISAVFDYGAGLIHEAEPAQAVIFETHKLDIIYHGRNKLAPGKHYEDKIIRLFYSMADAFSLNKGSSFKKFKEITKKSSQKQVKFFATNVFNVEDRKISEKIGFIYLHETNPDIIYFSTEIACKDNSESEEEHENIVKIITMLDIKNQKTYFFSIGVIPYINVFFENYDGDARRIIRNGISILDYYVLTLEISDSRVIGVMDYLPENPDDLFDSMKYFLDELRFNDLLVKDFADNKINEDIQFHEYATIVEYDGMSRFDIHEFRAIKALDFLHYYQIEIITDIFGQCVITIEAARENDFVTTFSVKRVFYGGPRVIKEKENIKNDIKNVIKKIDNYLIKNYSVKHFNEINNLSDVEEYADKLIDNFIKKWDKKGIMLDLN